MTTVTRRVKEVTQPRGGYINPRSMRAKQLDDGKPSPLDHKIENLHPTLVGTAVDYLSRLANGADPHDAFAVSLMGANNIGGAARTAAEVAVASLTPGKIDGYAIIAACKRLHFPRRLHRRGNGR